MWSEQAALLEAKIDGAAMFLKKRVLDGLSLGMLELGGRALPLLRRGESGIPSKEQDLYKYLFSQKGTGVKV